jgi:hypothetical protein
MSWRRRGLDEDARGRRRRRDMVASIFEDVVGELVSSVKEVGEFRGKESEGWEEID